jgi:hypothetical protein
MTQTFTVQFVHRLNEDNSIDSICRNCFITVATATLISNLEREERKHRCDPLLLQRYKKCQHREIFSQC